MATKKNDHMGDQTGQPKMQSYKFDKEVDERVKATKSALFDIDSGQPIVMAGTFKERRNAQIANRKRKGY